MPQRLLAHLAFTLLLFLNCKASNIQNFSLLIQGNWSTDYYHSNKPGDPDRTIYFTFEDSLCSILHLPYAAYSIFHDTLIVHSKWPTYLEKDKSIVRFLIYHLDSNSMILHSIKRQYWNPFQLDTIRLKKIKPFHAEKFDRIGFYLHVFPDGPEANNQYLELDSSGNLLIEGIGNELLNGSYAGTIQKKDIAYINQLIQSVSLHTLKPYYTARATHQNSWRILIKTSSGMYETGGYGFSKEPVPLLMLHNKLKELYQTANIQLDPLLSKQYQFSEFYENRNDVGYMRIEDPRPMKITKFIRNGKDETYLLDQYTFYFKPDWELLAIGNGITYYGKFKLIVNKIKDKPSDLIYHFEFHGMELLERLDVEWRQLGHVMGRVDYYHQEGGSKVFSLLQFAERKEYELYLNPYID